MGLAPRLVEQSFALVEQVHQQGTTILLVEQNAVMALAIAQRGYVLRAGRIVLADTAAALLANPEMRGAYLGGADAGTPETLTTTGAQTEGAIHIV